MMQRRIKPVRRAMSRSGVLLMERGAQVVTCACRTAAVSLASSS